MFFVVRKHVLCLREQQRSAQASLHLCHSQPGWYDIIVFLNQKYLDSSLSLQPGRPGCVYPGRNFLASKHFDLYNNQKIRFLTYFDHNVDSD